MKNEPKHSAKMTCLKPRSEESLKRSAKTRSSTGADSQQPQLYLKEVEGFWVDLVTLGTPRLSILALVVMTRMGREEETKVFSRSYK